MSVRRRLARLEKAATPRGVCPHLPWVVEGEGDEWRTEDERRERERRNALVCPCGRERGRIRIEYTDWGAPGGEAPAEPEALVIRWPLDTP